MTIIWPWIYLLEESLFHKRHERLWSGWKVTSDEIIPGRMATFLKIWHSGDQYLLMIFFGKLTLIVQNPIWNKRVEYIHKNVRRTKLAQLPDGTSFKGKKITTPFIVLAEMLVITSEALPKESCTIAKLSRQHNIRSKNPKSCIVLSQKALLGATFQPTDSSDVHT